MQKILVTTSSFDVSLFSNFIAGAQKPIEVVLNPYKRKLSEQEASELLTEDVIGMIAGVEPLSKKVLAGTKNLKVISRCGVGMDSVDLDAAKNLGILVTNTPDAPTIPVAELTMAHILNLLRHVSLVNEQIRDSKWEPKMGALLNGKTVGIIGYGRIGRKVASLAQAFGANILVFDIFPVTSSDNIKQVDLNQVLINSDIISLHLPYTIDNHHIISTEQFALMKPTALVLNISRGGLINEAALLEALLNNRIAGAGIDAFENEPYSGPLCQLPNVLLTAHMGSYAKEARYIMEQDAVKNLFCKLTELNLYKAL
jgi:D-3-phosphoglycerate dehydrogenase